VVTAYDQFMHEKNKFQLTEFSGENSIDLYRYIETMKLSLGLSVPKFYLEMIYDCIIQLAIGLEFMHDNNTIHGTLNLSNVLLVKDEGNPLFKLNNIKHGSVIGTPLNVEANQWPFSKGRKKNFNQNEKKEVLMLKDIYSLGICLLEMMIGRINENQYSITIDSLPLTWAELPESTPLIQVLVECLNIDSITQRKGKLANVKRILIKEYKKSFKKSFYKLEHIFTTDNPDILNKKAVFNNFKGDDTSAINYWNEALAMKRSHQDSVINLLFHRWKSAQIADQDVIEFMNKVDSINEKDSSLMLKALFMIAVGDKREGLAVLKKVLQGMKSQVGYEETKEEANESMLGLVGNDTLKDEEITNQNIKSRVLPIFHRIQLEKEKYFQNQTTETEHGSRISNVSISGLSKFMVTSSSDSVIVWTAKSKPKKLVHIKIGDSDKSHVISCIDPKGYMLFCYRQYDNKILYFTVDPEEGSYKEKESIPLPKEFTRDAIESLASLDSLTLNEMYFINEGKILR
jgi:serine/threonine protein kinase